MASFPRMPVIFFGHGSPMNALACNDYTRKLGQLGRELPKPRSILCISAHWMTDQVWITGMKQPKTIHDFHGFPEELFKVEYPAPGNPELAEHIQAQIPDSRVDVNKWGLDHGTWSVLKHVYPEANIPVLQLSLFIRKPAQFHFELGRKLQFLRDEGVLIIGSGNIVHNLREIVWETDATPFDWAVNFDEWAKAKIEARDYDALVYDYEEKEAGRLSVPTPDHYYPLLYVLGASDEKDSLQVEYEEIQNGSISMRTFSLGR